MKTIPGFSEFLSDLPFGAPGRRCALRGCGPSGNRTQWGLRHAVEPQTQTQQLAMSCSQKNIQTSRTKSNKVLWCSLWVRKTHIVVFLLTGQTFLILYTLWKSLSFAWFQSCSWTVFVSSWVCPVGFLSSLLHLPSLIVLAVLHYMACSGCSGHVWCESQTVLQQILPNCNTA